MPTPFLPGWDANRERDDTSPQEPQPGARPRMRSHLDAGAAGRRPARGLPAGATEPPVWRRLGHLLDGLNELLALLGPDGTVVTVNESVERVLGHRPQELVGRRAIDLVHPDDLPALMRLLPGLRDPGSAPTFEARIRHRDGSYRPLACAIRSDAVLGGLVVTGHDVTERREAEERIRLQGAALEAAADAIVITDRGGRIVWVNPAFERMTGYSRAEIEGQTPSVLRSGQHDKAFFVQLWSTILDGDVWSGEIVNRRRDGTVYHEEMTITPVHDDDGTIANFIAIKRDVTAARRLQVELRQAQKLESIGRLAGGVAHDFNNLLTVIAGYVDLTLAQLGPGDPWRQSFEEIMRAVQRGASLTRQLLVFSRRQVVQSRPLDLRSVVTGMERMLRRLIGEDIELTLQLGDRPHVVQADPGQMEQVIMNLAVNARDAMANGGSLSLSLTGIEVDGEQAASRGGVASGPYVLLSVRDTGVGMDDQVQSRLFEPFFTTKEAGKGTGLGLSTVYGIVTQCGGHIQVDSEPGRGSTFRVYLPRLSDESAAAVASTPAGPAPARGTETILLVEDDDPLRRLMQDVLEGHGYRVLAAPNGSEALLLAEQHEGPIHLMLTDVIMPRMSGRVLAARIAHVRPEMRVLFASGYTAETISRQGVLEPGVHFIQKPFTPEQLAVKLRAVLGETARSS